MKLLFIASLYPPDTLGGAEVALANKASGLAARGHRVSVLCTSAGKRWAVEVRDGVRVWRCPMPNLYPLYPAARHAWPARLAWHLADTYNPLAARAVRRALARSRPDLVITENLAGWSAAAWPAVKAVGLPLVHVLNDLQLLCPSLDLLERSARPSGGPACRLWRAPQRRLSRHVDAVIGLSRAVLERHVEAGYFAHASRHVIPTALALPDPGPPPAPPGPLRLGYIGRLAPSKGIEPLLAGLAMAGELDVTLDIAGSGTPGYAERLRGSHPDPRIRFLGQRPASDFYAHIDVLLVPSLRFDTLPTVIVEAAGASLPVLAAPVGGIPEMVAEGRTGYLRAMDSAAAVAAALRFAVARRDALAAMRPGIRAAMRRFLDRDAQLTAYEAAFAALPQPGVAPQEDRTGGRALR